MKRSPLNKLVSKVLEDAEEPLSAKEITAKLKSKLNTVNGHLRDLKADGKIYISGWERSLNTKGAIFRLYSFGGLKDVPRIDRLSRKEVCARYREKNHALLEKRTNLRRNNEVPVWLVGLGDSTSYLRNVLSMRKQKASEEKKSCQENPGTIFVSLDKTTE